MEFIIKWKSGLRGTRSEIDRELRRSGWGGTMPEEKVDKCQYLERKIADATGAKNPAPPQHIIDSVK